MAKPNIPQHDSVYSQHGLTCYNTMEKVTCHNTILYTDSTALHATARPSIQMAKPDMPQQDSVHSQHSLTCYTTTLYTDGKT